MRFSGEFSTKNPVKTIVMLTYREFNNNYVCEKISIYIVFYYRIFGRTLVSLKWLVLHKT